MLPCAAAAFALGLLNGPRLPPSAEPWMVFGVATGLLGVAWLTAGREHRGSAGLARAGLVDPDHAAVVSVRGGRVHAVVPVGSACLGLLAVVALGAGWFVFHDRSLDAALLAKLASQRVTLEGTLKTDPGENSFGWSAAVQVRRVRWDEADVTLRSSVWVNGNDRPPRAFRGDVVRLEGTLSVTDDPAFGEVLRRKGIPAELRVQTFRRVGPSANAFVRTAQSARDVVGGSIERVFPEKEAGLLLGLLLGDDSELDPGLERDFRAAGLSHLLVVSGGNVAMVLAPVLAATALLRLARWPRFVVGFGAVAFFTILTGAEPSVLRAGVMACLALIGVLAGRPRTTASILSAAVLALLVLDPWLAWSV